MKIYTQRLRPTKEEKKQWIEKNTGEIIVERSGYIPARKRIENLMLAGQRLIESRHAMYDFNAGEPIDENFYDPTREKDFDLADATRIQNDLEAKKNAANKLDNDVVGNNTADNSPDMGTNSENLDDKAAENKK